MKKNTTYILFSFGFLFFVNIVSAQNIYTFAGTGTPGYSGDGGPATAAKLEAPTGIVTDKKGNVYFCEWYYGLIRKVDASGIITTIAGGLVADLSNGIPAVSAFVKHPWGLTMDAKGNIYFAEQQYNQVRKIDTAGIITTIAGIANQTGGFAGDGGQGTLARLNFPSDVAVDNIGNVYIADCSNHRIRKVSPSGIITTIAGVTGAGFAGDGGPAINAVLYYPLGLAIDKKNNIYIGDAGSRIRKIDTLGIINTIAGTGVQGNTGDGGLAINAKIGSTRGLEVDSLGNLFFADRDYGMVRKVDTLGIITKIAGTGISGYSGDGNSATSAQLYSPFDVTFDSFGNLYITDNGNERIRKVCGTQPLSVITSTSTSCAAESVTLNVSGTSTYTWSTGSTNPIVIVTPTVNTTYTVNGADMVGCSYNAVFTQSVNACVGIREYDMDEIKIYPNPTTNLLQISDENNAFENSTLEVINYLGQTVIKQAYSNTVDVSKLPIGIYTLKIITLDKESYYSKFIKE